MKFTFLSSTLLLAMGTLFVSTNLHAETQIKNNFLTLGVATTPEYQGADSNDTVPFVSTQFYLGNNKIDVAGLSLSAELFRSGKWRAGLSSEFDMGRDDSVEEISVARLEEIDATLNVGAFLGYEHASLLQSNDEFSARLYAYTDASDVHEDQYVTLELGYKLALPLPWRLELELATTHAGDDYTQTYFGVNEANSKASGMPAYNAKGGIRDVSLSSNIGYFFNENWGLFSRLAYTQLQGDAADSPIVTLGDDSSFFAGIGVFYRF